MKMRAIITVIGKDTVGILAKTTNVVAKLNGNVAEVSQTILQGFFTMVMVIEIDKMEASLDEMKKLLEVDLPSMDIHVMHENIFNAMHRI